MWGRDASRPYIINHYFRSPIKTHGKDIDH